MEKMEFDTEDQVLCMKMDSQHFMASCQHLATTVCNVKALDKRLCVGKESNQLDYNSVNS